MIVDDDMMVNMVTERLLLRHNKEYEISTFTNPVKAFEHLSARKINHEDMPDLILLDIRMPQLSGFEFLEKLEESNLLTSLQVIMYTSSDAATDQEQSQYYQNVIGYMQKPFSIRVFDQIVDKILC